MDILRIFGVSCNFMKTRYIIELLLIVTIFASCNSAFINTSKNIKHGGANDSINLYAFVGEKISVIEFNPNDESEKMIEKGIDEDTGESIQMTHKKYVMDNAFHCKYKVLKKLFNYLPNDTIEFISYDHYVEPGFAQKDTIILYLTKNKETGKFYHKKYQYDYVSKDKNGNFFSYPKFLTEKDTEYGNENIKGFNVDLSTEKFSLFNLNTNVINIYYPQNFYKIENNYAIPIIGIYLYELINFRLNTTFKDL